jgi:hypothetical protein
MLNMYTTITVLPFCSHNNQSHFSRNLTLVLTPQGTEIISDKDIVRYIQIVSDLSRYKTGQNQTEPIAKFCIL